MRHFVASPILPVSYLSQWGRLKLFFSVSRSLVEHVSSLTCFSFDRFLFFFEWQVPWGHLKRKRGCVERQILPTGSELWLRSIDRPRRKPVCNSFVSELGNVLSVVLPNFTCLILWLSIFAHPCWQACLVLSSFFKGKICTNSKTAPTSQYSHDFQWFPLK